jgi:2-keto-4-pentenoate hydratase/2-oxohepta-3-ene-1,7-dioic acid hydratase in catechol pathway
MWIQCTLRPETMRVVTFAPHAGAPWWAWRTGLLVAGGASVLDLLAAGEAVGLGPVGQPPRGAVDWFDLEGPWCRLARELARRADRDLVELGRRAPGAVRPLSSVLLRAPVPRPGKIVAVGLNYRDHAAEARLPVPPAPVIFAKFPTALIGTGEAIVLPAGHRRIDYEGELAVVVGRRARAIPPAAALGAVFGFTNANDVSDRDFQKTDGQWVRAKSCDTFAPLGPSVVTLDEVPDPRALRIELRLNGVTMQASSTGQCVFDVPTLVSFISETITLEPGDVVLTGTPAGVGFARRPPVFLRPGDVVEVEVEGLGTLRNPVVGGPGSS